MDKDQFRAFTKAYIETNQKLRKIQTDCHLPDFEIFRGFYGEEVRYYHNQNHIMDLLILHNLCVENTKMSKLEDAQVEVAIWFHDIIYQPKQIDNETRSAILFYSLSPDFKDYDISDAIGATITHSTHFEVSTVKLPNWSKYMLDLDLAGLGSGESQFQSNTLRIRLENSHVNNKIFYKNRIGFLERLLNRGRPIYYNPYNLNYFKDLEVQAHINITKELSKLYRRNHISK